jgi:hypothetical protein
MQKVYAVGGHIRDENDSKGNLFTVPSNRYAEFNMFLDPLAAKTVLESSLDITLIPLSSQRKAASFQSVLQALNHTDRTPESCFVHRLLLSLHHLQEKHGLYHHMVNVFNFFCFSATAISRQKRIMLIALSHHCINNSIMVHKSSQGAHSWSGKGHWLGGSHPEFKSWVRHHFAVGYSPTVIFQKKTS